MTSSADVAARAGVSRSTVSQILNGHGHRFKPDMVELVQDAARELGYRPSLAGRSLALGKSDIVIGLIPDITFGPRLRELTDRITNELGQAGKTHLLRLASTSDDLEGTIMGLRPAGLWSVAPLTEQQRSKLTLQKVPFIDQPLDLQIAIDHEIGAAQAQYLASAGYQSIAVVMPNDHREQPLALAREAGVLDWCRANQVVAQRTMHISMERDDADTTIGLLPRGSVGIAAYNDEAAIAVLTAAIATGRRVPAEFGVIGVDNSLAARVMIPSLTTVDLDVEYSAHEIVHALLHGTQTLPVDPIAAVRRQIHVLQGGSTRAVAPH
jgi:DNA-binding LacI/PurR family transcriptional regulator